jgi:ADP-ribose pyrophosphatase YjhB (NUDIX family)
VIENLKKLGKTCPTEGAGLLFVSNAGPDFRVLLFKPVIRPQRGTWSIDCGRCKERETYLEAAIRAASEEICGRRPFLKSFHDFLPKEFDPCQAREHILCEVPMALAGERT